MFKTNFVRLYNAEAQMPSYVCRQVGLAPATFSCWTDESIPRRATLQRIADYFGVTIDDLLRAPNEPAPTAEPSTEPDPLFDEFAQLLDQLTVKELREIKAIC